MDKDEHINAEEVDIENKTSEPESLSNSNSLDDSELKEKIVEYEDLLKRQAADFNNFRKRVIQEKEEIQNRVSEQVIVDFLPILDNLERALSSSESGNDIEGIKEGVKAIYHIFLSILGKYQVEMVESLGMDFDPSKHEAFYITEGEFDRKLVTQEIEKAFQRKGRTIRIAKVAVGIPKEENVSGQSD